MPDYKLALNKFCAKTIGAVLILHEKKYYGQMLIIIYSAIDTFGLLDAEISQNKATGETFKNWTKKYFLENGDFDFDEVDFWSARCAVLHTFTTESDLSRSGKAIEIQYFKGDPKSREGSFFQDFVNVENCVSANIDDVLVVFLESIACFIESFTEKCLDDTAYQNRVNNLLGNYYLKV